MAVNVAAVVVFDVALFPFRLGVDDADDDADDDDDIDGSVASPQLFLLLTVGIRKYDLILSCHSLGGTILQIPYCSAIGLTC